jgi:hypothetical protein
LRNTGVERTYYGALSPVKETGSFWRIHHYAACTDFFFLKLDGSLSIDHLWRVMGSCDGIWY